ncbi:MAG: prolipoprotein diacylglyceryl transferase [Chloroflexia bacterium]|nr:prolipoprotein diacylglyceryl transferase [Chloroflexia bacterium]
MHRYIKLGTNLIDTYNVFLLIALIIVSLILEKQIDNLRFDKRKTTLFRLFMPIAVVVGLFGASLFEIISQNKSIALENFDSGLTFYGGLITALILVIFYGLIFKIPILFLLNFYSKPLVLGHAIGRIGCFFAGCCYGKPTSFITGVKFPIDSLPYLQYGACKIHPTQLYESIFLFLLFISMTKIKSTYHL